MERKSHISANVNSDLQRSNYPRKILHYSNSSSIPRLPPILQKENNNSSSPTQPRRRKTDNFQREFTIDSKQTKATFLPKLEKSHFEANTVYFKVKNDSSNLLPSDMSPGFGKPELKPIDRSFGYFGKQETANSSSILRIRRKKKDRLSSYKCSPNTAIDDEISELEQRVGFEAISAPSRTTTVKDMKGRMIQSADVYNEEVSSLITMLDEDEKLKKVSEKDLENTPLKKTRSTSVRQRFLKALDVHFFNEFVNSKSGRRMAICEELEKTISGDGKTSLTGLREHLRLQDVLDSWVL